MNKDNIDWVNRDKACLWHPCTQMKDHEQIPPIPIASAKGVWLSDYEGNNYLDAISSWWVNLFGHSDSEITQAIQKQTEQFSQVIFAGFSHKPAIEVAEKLIKLTPSSLKRVFYADNGSSAVDCALKMSFHYWHNIGKKQKTQFVSLQNSYHGETLGSLSVSDCGLYRKIYEPLLWSVKSIAGADLFLKPDDEDEISYTERCFIKMKQHLEQNHEQICAVIIEPLVQCAGGMRMYSPHYLKLLRQACDEYDIHLIFDEIAVGFGRTGRVFASEHANVTPDIMTVSKGITGGFLPLAAVLTTDKMFDAFYHDYTEKPTFLHSHSYTGNALALAAANATLDKFIEQPIISQIQTISKQLQESLLRFKSHPHIADIRQIGLIAALEFTKNGNRQTPFPAEKRLGREVYRQALARGLLIRPLGDVIYFIPPYITTPKDIDFMLTITDDIVRKVYQ